MSVFDVCSFILILIAVIFEYYYIYTFFKAKKGNIRRLFRRKRRY